jgi:hypothetical protein
MGNLLSELLTNLDYLVINTRQAGKHCRYCSYRTSKLGKTVICSVEATKPELCPEAERQLRAVKFHLDCALHLTDVTKNNWLRDD